MSKKKGIPSKDAAAEITKLKEENSKLRMAFGILSFRILFARDVLERSGDEISQRGRMTKEVADNFNIQIAVMDNLLKNHLGVTPDAARGYRSNYVKEEFEEAVRKTSEEFAPLVVIPTLSLNPTKKPGKFLIEN